MDINKLFRFGFGLSSESADNGGYYFRDAVPTTEAPIVIVSAPWAVTSAAGQGSVYTPDAIIDASTATALYDVVTGISIEGKVATAEVDYDLQESSLQLGGDAAKVVAHPECPASLLETADYIGSTAGILDFCGSDDASEYIVVTEPGILTEMHKRFPKKTFIPAPAEQSPCNECKYMKMVTLENILSCLENGTPEVILDEPTRQAAERAILNMIAIK